MSGGRSPPGKRGGLGIRKALQLLYIFFVKFYIYGLVVGGIGYIKPYIDLSRKFVDVGFDCSVALLSPVESNLHNWSALPVHLFASFKTYRG